jgi:hypothetical protein
VKEASTLLEMEHGRFPYSPIVDRPSREWPNGAYAAVWIAPNVEHFHLDDGSLAAGQPHRMYQATPCATTAIAWPSGA